MGRSVRAVVVMRRHGGAWDGLRPPWLLVLVMDWIHLILLYRRQDILIPTLRMDAKVDRDTINEDGRDDEGQKRAD